VSEEETMVERTEQRRIVEALVLAAAEPIPATKLAAIVPECSTGAARELVAELNAEYEARGASFEIVEVAGGYQLRTRPDLAPWLRELQPRRTVRLSRAALETLAVVAYKQPITRAEIEHVRGVDAGAVVRSLLERDLVRIAGHREIPGRPMLYATTKRFLELFGLASLEDLPTLRDLQELSSGQETTLVLSSDEAPAEGAVQEDLPGGGFLTEGAADDELELDPDLDGDDDAELRDAGDPEETPGKPH
jgi:segregation and condensation protein B